MRALILANGTEPSEALFYKYWEESTLRVAADGGVIHFLNFDKIPDVVVGDLDSFPSELKEHILPQFIIHSKDQQTNDLDKSIQYCLEQSIHRIDILGASGRRMDHFLANLEVLYKYSEEADIWLWTENEGIHIITSEWKTQLPVGSTLSLIPSFGEAHDIYTEGLQYKLQGNSLIPGLVPCGLSNKVCSSEIKIQVGKGKLTLILPQVTLKGTKK